MNKLLSSSYSSRVINNSLDKQVSLVIKSYIDNYNRQKDSNNKILISDPIFKETHNRIQIDVFFFEGQKNKFSNDFLSSNISQVIRKYCSKDISINFVKIHYPYINASIFSQYLFYNSSANTFMHFQNSVLRYLSWHGSELISYIKGIKIEISGRIMTEKVIPRVTRKSAVFGSLSNCDYIDYSKYTQKNFIGSITIKVWIAIKMLAFLP
jgi:hypothetical protein